MRGKPTQEKLVTDHLLEHGSISRNYCLQNFITRLSAIILDLNKDGWDIKGDYEKTQNGRDYVYQVVTSPFKKVAYRTPDGTIVKVAYERV